MVVEIISLTINLLLFFFKISERTKGLLEAAGGFYYTKRESGSNKLPPDVTTYWLLGRLPEDEPSKIMSTKSTRN